MYTIHLKPLVAQIQSNWLKIGLALLLIYVVSVKDMSFQFSLNNAQIAPLSTSFNYETRAEPVVYRSNITPPSTAVGTAKSKFSIWDIFSSRKDNKTADIFEQETHTLSEEALAVANNFSNLGFILNPSYAKKHQLDPAIVKHKEKYCMAYLKRFAPVAIAEMKKYGIPASITLAQALLESNAGDSKLTQKNKNHFGIKCFSKKCKKGHCSNFMDDGHKDFFRKYNSSWDSFRDHSIFLSRKRYQHLKELNTNDYVGWARGLKAAGYATDKRYAEKLIQLIEVFQLYDLDA
ncbi:MAG: glycoside hydrolase family 73 protein [Saprospiraceae bacterium]